MSCYEWERGDLKLSVKEYSRVKKAMIAEFNRHNENEYNKAVKVWERLKAHGKPRGQTWTSVFDKLQLWSMSEDFQWHNMKDGKLLKPKKKDYLKKVDRKRVEIYFEDACIVFNDKDRVIHWNVGENNHAKDRAWDHPLGKVFYNILRRVDWTRGTGGIFVGNDEYNRDSDYEGGGGNYVTARFGPLGKEKTFARAF